MIDRFIGAVQRVIGGVIGILVLFGLLVGLIVWARSDPDAVQALIAKLLQAAVSVITWLCDLLVRTLDGTRDQ